MKDGESQTTDLPAGLVQLLHFRDTRPYHEVQFALERKLVALFAGGLVNNTLTMRAEADVNGARFTYDLQLEAARLFKNYYSFRAEGSWAHHVVEHDQYFRGTSRSWFKFWTSDLTPTNPPDAADNSTQRYASMVQAAMQAEAHLNSTDAIQRAIIAALKSGGSYSTSHKEGGSVTAWKNRAFVRETYGDNPSMEKFADEDALLEMLWHSCEGDVTRHAVGNTISDLNMWRLIWRRLDQK